MTLDEYRKSRDLTLEQLASELGLASTGHASDIASGRRGMPVAVAKRFALLTGKPWPELFDANRKTIDPHIIQQAHA